VRSRSGDDASADAGLDGRWALSREIAKGYWEHSISETAKIATHDFKV
jgi:hypothetical protein